MCVCFQHSSCLGVPGSYLYRGADKLAQDVMGRSAGGFHILCFIESQITLQQLELSGSEG